MEPAQNTNQPLQENENHSSSTGIASNPSPHLNHEENIHGNQLLNKDAEKYLREVASIEDLPDAQDQQDMDKTIEADTEQP